MVLLRASLGGISVIGFWLNGWVGRTFYAVTRVLVTRQDDGSKMFNFSEVVGSGAAAGVSTVYYPKQY
jgi:hypothetical protein